MLDDAYTAGFQSLQAFSRVLSECTQTIRFTACFNVLLLDIA